MATKTLAALVAAATLLAGCHHGPPVYDWASPAGHNFYRDKLQCQQVSQAAVGNQFVMGSLMMVAVAAEARHDNMQQAFNDCMMAEGYMPDGPAR